MAISGIALELRQGIMECRWLLTVLITDWLVVLPPELGEFFSKLVFYSYTCVGLSARPIKITDVGGLGRDQVIAGQ